MQAKSFLIPGPAQLPGSNFPFRYPKSAYLQQDDERTAHNDVVGVIGFAYVVAPWLLHFL